jgi:hypothetical protein
MADSRYKLFFVYCHNNVNCADDQVIKVKAKTKVSAKRLVAGVYGHRCAIGRVYTNKGLKRFDSEWHSLLWGVPPSIVE